MEVSAGSDGQGTSASSSSHETGESEQVPVSPSRVLIVSPTGEYCVGVDENHKPEPSPEEDGAGSLNDERRGSADVLNQALSLVRDHHFLSQFPNLTHTHETALYQRRKRSFMILLALDFCYFLLLFLIKLLISKQDEGLESPPTEPPAGENSDVALMPETEATPASPEVPIMIFTPMPGYEVIDLCVNLALDGTGLLGAMRDSISTLTFFIIGESVATAMSALHRLSPFLIFRVIIVMLGFQVRAGCHSLHRQQQQMQQQMQQHLAALERTGASGDLSSLLQGRHFLQMSADLHLAASAHAANLDPTAGSNYGTGPDDGGRSVVRRGAAERASFSIEGPGAASAGGGELDEDEDVDEAGGAGAGAGAREGWASPRGEALEAGPSSQEPAGRTLQTVFNQRRLEFRRTYLQLAFLASMLQPGRERGQDLESGRRDSSSSASSSHGPAASQWAHPPPSRAPAPAALPDLSLVEERDASTLDVVSVDGMEEGGAAEASAPAALQPLPHCGPSPSR